MNYTERIVADHRVMLGKPVIKGTRITVELILRKMSEGAKPSDLTAMYPHLEEADVLAALDYAALVLANEEVVELSAK
jgi:uncharacterized protein (DUF433 family)